MGAWSEFIKRLFSVPGGVRKGGISRLEDGFQELVNQKRVPGISVTILREGETIFQSGFGYAEIGKGQPVDPQKTLFRIASASKPIAAMALATMVSEGSIDLDRSLYDYVPYFPRKKYDFTIRQLASHTAGIRGYRGKEYALDKPYSVRDGLKIFQDDPLEFQPGTGYLYNSFDWVLISLAMEEVSGLPFSRYVRERVLAPLGMDNTLEEFPGSLPDHAAAFYTRSRSGFRSAISVDNRYKLAGGGYLSTSRDLAELGKAFLENALVPPGIMQEFLTPQLVNGKSTYYGLGWQVSTDSNGRPFVGHVGNGIGGYSNFFVYPEEELVVSLLINCTDPGVQGDIDENLGLLFSESPLL